MKGNGTEVKERVKQYKDINKWIKILLNIKKVLILHA